MILETERLILRRWSESDAGDLYEYAKDPDVGPIAGWQPHKDAEESLDVIKNVLSGKECYAVCLKPELRPIGAIELMLNGHTALASKDDECELGYWLGKPFWGRGIIPEAAREMLRHAFEDLGMSKVWCGYFEGNANSKRVQEKIGLRYQRTETDVYVPLMREKRTEHFTRITKEEWIKMNNFMIRAERKEDEREVENLIRESFWNVYRPGCSEHYVMHVLRGDPAFVRELDFVMEQDGRLIGQNVFVRTVINGDDGKDVPVLTMGPICITPELKRKGYGKKLLDYSLSEAAKMGFGAVLFEGNIAFYGKSGFDYASKFGVRYHDLPEGADSSFFLCKELIPGYLDGVTGVYQTPKGYYVNDAETEKFDLNFPPKQKLKLSGQLFE